MIQVASIEQLAEQINNNLSSALSLERYLSFPQVYMHPDVFKVMCDLLGSPVHIDQQKMMAAVSLKLIYTKRFQRQQYSEFRDKSWSEYFNNIVARFDSPNDRIDWKYVWLTVSALRYLIEQLDEENIKGVFIDTFAMTNFYGKVLLYEAILLSQQTNQIDIKYVIFRETMEMFITNLWKFVQYSHSQQFTLERLTIEHDAMLALKEVICYLKQLEEQRQEAESIQKQQQEMDLDADTLRDKLFVLAKNSTLIQLIKQQLRVIVEISRNNQPTFVVSERQFEIVGESLLSNSNIKNREIQRIVKLLCQIRVATFSVLNVLGQEFWVGSTLQHFDKFQVLSLLETLTPALIRQLYTNDILKPCKSIILSSEDYETLHDPLSGLVTAMMQLIRCASRFIFMMQVFQQQKDELLYGVIVQYTKTTRQEQDLYRSDDVELLDMAQTMVEKGQMEPADTIKEAAGCLLEGVIKLVNACQVEFVEFLDLCLEQNLKREKPDFMKDHERKGYSLPTTQQIHTLISRIYYFSDKTNEDFLKYVYDRFLIFEQVRSLKKLEKVKLIRFLTYCYSQYWQKNMEEGGKWIKWAIECKDLGQIQNRVCMDLLLESFHYGFGSDVWKYLINNLKTTSNIQEIRVIKHILNSYHSEMPSEYLMELIGTTCNRIKTYYKEEIENMTNHGGHCDLLYKCFDILDIAAQKTSMIRKEQQCRREILGLWDFFKDQNPESLVFNDRLIAVLNHILKAQEKVDSQFMQYIQSMSLIVRKQGFFGEVMLETYYLLLLKGGDLFESEPQHLKLIQESIENNLMVGGVSSILLIEGIFLLQNIYLVYPRLIKQNPNMYQLTLQLYEEQKNSFEKNKNLIASLALYWMAGEYAFGNFNLGLLQELEIELFQQEFGLMMSLNLRKLIEKYCYTESLPTLLKLGFRLLDYQHYYKNLQSYRGPKFSIQLFRTHIIVDSFEQIASAVEYLKSELSQQEFSDICDFLRQQIGGDRVNTLLSRRIFGNKKERVIRTVRRDEVWNDKTERNGQNQEKQHQI